MLLKSVKCPSKYLWRRKSSVLKGIFQGFCLNFNQFAFVVSNSQNNYIQEGLSNDSFHIMGKLKKQISNLEKKHYTITA